MIVTVGGVFFTSGAARDRIQQDHPCFDSARWSRSGDLKQMIAIAELAPIL